MKNLLLILALLCPALAQAAPVCMYQDNLSGPAVASNGGSEGSAGTYVDVFGTGFGASLGSVTGTINGTTITNFIYLGANKAGSRQKIGFQVPAGTTGTGSIVLNFPGGSCSNLGFTVRTAQIWYIGSGIDNATSGSLSCSALKAGTALDGNAGSGTYANPWKMNNTLSTQINGGGSNIAAPFGMLPSFIYQCINGGDQIVLLNGFNFQYADWGGDYTSWVLNVGYMQNNSNPTVIMARPGASATIGNGVNTSTGIRDTNDTGFVLSGLTVRGQGNCIGFTEPSTGPYMRIVDNDVSAPTGAGSSACVTGGQEAQVNVGTVILGNYFHGTSCGLSGGISNKQYHSAYLTGNGIEFGWNTIAGDCTWNGFQWNYYTDNTIGFGLGTIHDNDISGVNGSGINMPTVDTAQGAISIYNNIIHHVGIQPASDGDAIHSCLSFPGEAPSAVGTGTVNVYNNTFADCSVYAGASNSTTTGTLVFGFETAQTPFTINLVNNIFYQPAYTYTSSYNIFFVGGSPQAILTGSKNIFYYGGSPSSTTPASSLTSLTVPTDPKFANNTFNGSWTNLALQSSSPAISAGTTPCSTLDFAGVTQTSPCTLGALVYVASGAASFFNGFSGSGFSLH